MPEAVEKPQGAQVMFMTIDGVKFRKPVVPGDQLVCKMRALRKGSRFWKVAGEAFVDDNLVAEANFLATIG
jgi:3-hydroxymyristoyl/3-hydroxydecanoyl-(acyl carrier protein) dehydratase